MTTIKKLKIYGATADIDNNAFYCFCDENGKILESSPFYNDGTMTRDYRDALLMRYAMKYIYKTCKEGDIDVDAKIFISNEKIDGLLENFEPRLIPLDELKSNLSKKINRKFNVDFSFVSKEKNPSFAGLTQQ